MQLEGVFSISQPPNSFIGTGLLAREVPERGRPPVLSVMTEVGQSAAVTAAICALFVLNLAISRELSQHKCQRLLTPSDVCFSVLSLLSVLSLQ